MRINIAVLKFLFSVGNKSGRAIYFQKSFYGMCTRKKTE